MSLMRSALLAASQNAWLRSHAPRYGFVRAAVRRFMPGERLEDALAAASELQRHGIPTVFTELGENVINAAAAEAEAERYVEVLRRVREAALPTEVSVKLTHLGLDLDPELCFRNLERVVEHAAAGTVAWIDMESTQYTDATIALFRRARERSDRVGLCLQAYLYRTKDDLEKLLPLGPAIRLVKGAYKEPADKAFPRKRDVDQNFYTLTTRLLSDAARQHGARAALATHDVQLIGRINTHAYERRLGKQDYEFQMLYGIQRGEQLRLAREGYRSIVLVAYGTEWYAWYVRRLAERPANLWFVAKNIFG
jgi:proline dehydrogenase